MPSQPSGYTFSYSVMAFWIFFCDQNVSAFASRVDSRAASAAASGDAPSQTHKDTLVRFLKGYVEGVRYARANPKQTMEVMAKYTKMTDPEATEENYRVFSPFWEDPPFMNEASMQTALTMSTNPKAGQFKAKDFIDNGIVQELSNRGLFK